ncbi:MAG: acetolactate synthase small subunit [Bacillota bacterium]|nr:MAG: acetolactate synthase small subunit [Bacillota bacterium]
MRHIMAVLVENNPGVLARVAMLIRRRGFNIESLAVGPTENPRIARITLVVEGDGPTYEQVQKQLYKLIEVLKVSDLDPDRSVAREVALIKVHADPARRPQLLQLAEVFRARVVDVGRRQVILEVTGTEDKVEALIHLAREFGLLEVVRTGVVALERGPQAVRFGKEEAEDVPDVLRLGR